MAEDRLRRRLAAILAADVAGYSRLMGADEEGTLARLKAHRRDLVDPKINEHHGRIVKATGDGVLVEFASVVDAVRCAAEIQRGMTERNAEVPPAARIEFRVGINVGDVILDGDDIYGDGVNVAARLEGLAEPGGICASGRVQEDVRGKLDIAFEDGGEQRLKNIALPVRVFRLRRPGNVPAPAPELSIPDKPSIAVLPFENMSGDQDQEYFADGVVEDIITALSRFKELFVIARNSSFVYKGRAVDVRQIAGELGVRYVLEGSVRRAGSRVRITGQLIDASTRMHLWADRFDGALEDVFDLQDRVTEHVVGALLPTLRRAEIERARRKPPASLEAYDYLLRSLPHIVANTPGEVDDAVGHLNEALRLDPDYVYAHALMANVQAQIYRGATGRQREEAKELAIRHAQRAVALGADDSLALATAGFVLLIVGQDAEAARRALDTAVALNPSSATALAYSSLVLAATGDPSVAIDHAMKALRLSPLDPLSYLPHMGIAIARLMLDENQAAVAAARKAIEINPRFPMAHAWLIVAECACGNKGAAEAQLLRLRELLPGLRSDGLAGLFDIFPAALRAKATGALQDGCLVAASAP
jgi:TolB-like protein/Flp pilus assembly protein TadD